LDANVTLVNPYASLNAESSIIVTDAGIIASPVHDDPSETTPRVTVKLPLSQLIAACAGLKTRPESTNADVIRRVAILRILKSIFG
jgi:hypothetical protein